MQVGKIIKQLPNSLIGLSLTLLPTLTFAEELDPATKAGHQFYLILFGGLGTSLCAIIIGATFLMAKVGKVTWERALFVGFCCAGFLGAPSIVTLMKKFVG